MKKLDDVGAQGGLTNFTQDPIFFLIDFIEPIKKAKKDLKYGQNKRSDIHLKIIMISTI